MSYTLNALYRTLGVSKQSVQQAKNRQDAFDLELAELVLLANQIKGEHPGCGVEKMYTTLKPRLMGRDKFCEIFMELGYGVKRVRNYHRTTYSGHIYYPNLIEGMVITRPFQVVQSDITYFYLNGEFYYLVFIIDVYTRLVVGYSVNDHLRASANVCAMKMALKMMSFQPNGLIHHSDKGTQYSSHEYSRLLKAYQIHISMGNVAWENPYAERINGIIKNEYLKLWKIRDYKDLKRKTTKAVEHYNTKRLHRAFNMKFTPREFYNKLIDLSIEVRPVLNVYTESKNNFKQQSTNLQVSQYDDQLSHICQLEMKCKS